MKALTLCIGRRGKGKSTLALELARREAEAAGARIVVYDIKGDFRKWPGATTADPDEFEAMLFDPIEAGVQDPSVIVYRPEDNEFEEFGKVAKAVKLYAESPDGKPIVFIIDEAWMLQENSALHEDLSRLQRLADTSRIAIIETAHRPVDFARRTRAIASHWYVFQITEAADLDAIAERCGMEAAEKARALAGHDYLAHDLAAGNTEICKGLTKPETLRLERMAV